MARHFLLTLVLLIPTTAKAQQTFNAVTVNDGGNTVIVAGDFASDGGGDIASVDTDGNIHCVPSHGGLYDLPAVISTVHSPPGVGSWASGKLNPNSSDYMLIGTTGVVNVYASDGACNFNLSQTEIIQGLAQTIVIIPNLLHDTGPDVAVTTDSAFAAAYGNTNGTLTPGPAGLGAGLQFLRAGSSIVIENFVEPQPPGPLATVTISVWTYNNGWTSTPPVVPHGIPLAVATAPATKSNFLISHDLTSVDIQQLNADGSLGPPMVFNTPEEAIGAAIFGTDSIAIIVSASSQILEDSEGDGNWILGSLVTSPIVQPPTFFGGPSATLPNGFAAQKDNGTPSAVAFETQATAMISVPVSLLFGSTAIGQTAELPLPIKNTGNQPLAITLVTITGQNSGDFTATGDCPSVSPGTTCTLNLTFSPSTFALETAAVVLDSNAPGSPTTVNVTAALSPAPVVSVSATRLEFGIVTVGSTSTRTLTIGNSGQFNLANLSIQIVGSQFAISGNTCPVNLAVLASCTVTASLTPTMEGGIAGGLTIFSSISPVTVDLSGIGTGAAPTVAATPPSLTTSGTNSTVTAQISFSNFTTTPTITASCQIPKGSCAIQNNSTLVVTITPRTASELPWKFPGLILLAAFATFLAPRKRRLGWAVAGALALCACGGSGNTTPPQQTGTPAGTYHIAVTATAGAEAQSVNVPLVVN